MVQKVSAGFENITKQNVHAGQAMPGDYFPEKNPTIIALIKVII